MSDVVYLAWRYLAYHRVKTSVLAASVTLIVYLPIGLNILVGKSANQLTSRASKTPLLVGAKGSPLELVLRSLYFQADIPSDLRYREFSRVKLSKLATAIPIHARYRTRHSPIVGTSLDYFSFRELDLEDGRLFAMLGECVLGANAARDAGAGPGDSVISASDNVFDIAGVYPLKMRVAGVLLPTGTPDDDAVFVDIKTTWVIAGLGHGHQELESETDSNGVVLRRDDDGNVVANAALVNYNEITPENAASFHFHGNRGDFPITSVIAVPKDAKSGTLLQGRYLAEDDPAQIVNPLTVMDRLLATVLTVRQYVLMVVALVAMATLATMTLVFVLSFQLRRREMETLRKIGGSQLRVTSLLAAEVISVILLGVVGAVLLSFGTLWLADAATRLLIQIA